MTNLPQVKPGIVSVSRNCFPKALSERRRRAVVQAYGEELYECPVCVENEKDVVKALKDVKDAGVNALCVYLGNFGPETPETLLVSGFGGPVICVAAAEGDGDLVDGRGDAFCGMLSFSYNLGLRGVKAFIPGYPVMTAPEAAKAIADFIPEARAVIGLSELKVITFGPRPSDFLACNAPIKPLYSFGAEIEENSELDLLVAYRAHENDPRIPAKVAEMKAETGESRYGGILERLAAYELTLLDWAEEHKGLKKYVAFANKCWPSFQTEFGFVPCYVNSRLTGIYKMPVACEVDVFGAISEYLGLCLCGDVTLLDLNNSVPGYIYNEDVAGKLGYKLTDLFMGFHCGNTCSAYLKDPHISYQRIMKRSLEPDRAEPDITRGTLEGDIKAGDITFFRLQSTSDGALAAYIAQGEVLDVPTRSFGGSGIFAVREMGRFYRYALIEKRFPHHGAVAFGHCGKAMFDVLSYLGVKDISYNLPAGTLYPAENPFNAG